MKTICQALMDEIHYPVPKGFVENVIVKRGLNADDFYEYGTARSNAYQGAVADCLLSLLHAVSFSEADKSFGSLSDKDKERILIRVNSIYKTIGEPPVETEAAPVVYVGDDCLL